jgi:hypothetical protein
MSLVLIFDRVTYNSKTGALLKDNKPILDIKELTEEEIENSLAFFGFMYTFELAEFLSL